MITKRQLNTALFVADALLAVACAVVALHSVEPAQSAQPKQFTESIPDPVPVVTTLITGSESVPKHIPVVDPVVAQQEARMPEFGWDYEYVMRVVAAESRGEPYEGQLAVAQCIYNTAELRNMTPEEVVKEKNQYASPVASELVTESVRDACCAVFVMHDGATDVPIRFFYSTRNGFVSKWHENNLEYVMTIGNHKFFKERGN